MIVSTVHTVYCIVYIIIIDDCKYMYHDEHDECYVLYSKSLVHMS